MISTRCYNFDLNSQLYINIYIQTYSIIFTIDDPSRSSAPKEGVLQEANIDQSPIEGKHHLTPSSK